VTGTIAYAGSGEILQVIDFSNPDAPNQIGSLILPAAASSSAISGTVLFLGDGSSLLTIDVSNPITPTQVSALSFPNPVTDVVVVGTYAYVTEGTSLVILDVSDPTGPLQVGLQATQGTANGVANLGSYAYIASSALQIIDVSKPTSPALVGSFLPPCCNPSKVAVADGYAYLIEGGEVLVVDVTDPKSPGLATTLCCNFSAITVKGTMAYVGSQNGVTAYDVSTPSSPQFESSVSVPDLGPLGQSSQLVVNGTVAYDARGLGGLDLVDVVNPSGLTLASTLPALAAPPSAVAVSGGTAYLAAGSMLIATDVSTPSRPTLLGTLTVSNTISSLVVIGHTAYLADGSYGLVTVDVSDPAKMVQLGNLQPGASTTSIAVSGSMAFLGNEQCCFSGYLFVADVSDPTNPSLDSTVSVSGGVNSIAAITSTLYLANGNSQLVVYDVSNPLAPAEVASVTAGDCCGVGVLALSGSQLYWATGTSLTVVSISAPTAPAIEGTVAEDFNASGLAVSGSNVFETSENCCGAPDLAAVSVGNPSVPTLAGTYRTLNAGFCCSSIGVAPLGSSALVADGTGGLLDLALDYTTRIPVQKQTAPSGAMSAYTLINSNNSPLTVQQAFANTAGSSVDTYSETVAAGSSTTYHLQDIPQITAPFTGTVTLTASQPFGYYVDAFDYPYFIAGQVMDSASQPIAGVAISAGTGITTTTDAGGNYTLGDLPAGTYTPVATLLGYRFTTAAPVTIPPNAAEVNFVGTAVPPPTVGSVSPLSAYAYAPITMTVTGTGFWGTPTVTLGGFSLSNVAVVDADLLTATVPAGLPAGAYNVVITNADGAAATMVNGFSVMADGDGSLGNSVTTPSFTARPSDPVAVQSGGRIYVLGGGATTVEYAQLNADGSVGDFSATSSMTAPRTMFAAAAWNGVVYALGGTIGGMVSSSVEFARINPDGTLGAWQSADSLTTARTSLSAISTNGYLYALGGSDGNGNALSSVEFAPIKADGSLGAWQATTPMQMARFSFAATTLGGIVYVLGGFEPCVPCSYNVALSTVEQAYPNSDGTIAAWQAGPPLVYADADVTAAVSDGYIYESDAGELFRAAVQPDGTLGGWSYGVGYLPILRANPSLVASGDNLYDVGGDSYGGELNNGEWFAVDPPYLGNLDHSVIAGSKPTAITAYGSNFIASATISIAPTIGSPIVVTTTVNSRTSLTSVVPAGLASGPAIFTLLNGDGHKAAGSATLVVDGTAPSVSELTINGGALLTTSSTVYLNLSATDLDDALSNLQIAFSSDGVTWGPWEYPCPMWAYGTNCPPAGLFSWNLPAGDGPKTIYAQAMDPAGNLSNVVSQTISLNSEVPSYYGLSINDGALFTNTPDVTLTIGGPPGTSQMQISNDGLFEGAVWQPYTTTVPWTVNAYGDYTTLVYVKYQNVLTPGTVIGNYLDDIVLDTIPPTGSVAIASAAPPSSAALTLSAYDKVSGVPSMRLSNFADLHDAAWQPYATSATWNFDGGNAVYAQFEDGAGNVSDTYSASLPVGSVTETATETGTATATVAAEPSTTPTATETATATATSTLTPGSADTTTPTATPTVTSSVVSAGEPSPVGISAYTAGNDQNTTFYLPLVRNDNGFNTIIHVANSTTGATNVTVTFLNPDGSVAGTVTQPLGIWASWDVDAFQQAPAGFDGSAVVSASQNAVAVSVDVVDGALTSGNLASYAGLTVGSAQNYSAAALKNFHGIDSTLVFQNTTANAATATLSFSGIATTAMVNVPPSGSAVLDLAVVNGLPTTYSGVVAIQSDQPLVGIETMMSSFLGQSSYSLYPVLTGSSAAASAGIRVDANDLGSRVVAGSAASTWLLPSLADNAAPGAASLLEASAITFLNSGSASSTVDFDFYDSAGNLACALSQALQPGAFVTMFLPNVRTCPGGSALVTGAVYSAVVSSDQPGIVAASTNLTENGLLTAQFAYPAYVGQPGGSWAYVPGLRKLSGATESTELTVMNGTNTSQTYRLDFWDASGNFVEEANATLAGFGFQVFDQSSDANLPAGFSGSVQVTNTSGGPPPAVIANLVASQPSLGTVTMTATATPTSTSTSTGTPTSSSTSAPTGTPSSSPTLTASRTPTETATPTSSATSAPSSTATSSSTVTATLTFSATSTATMSSTPTARATITLTPTSTIAPIGTSTVIPANSTEVATVVSNNGQVTLAIPPNFVGEQDQEQNVGVTLVPTTLPTGTSLGNGATPLLVLQVNLSDNGTPTAGQNFLQPLTLTVSYDPAQLAASGVDPATLKIYLVDSTTGAVTVLNSQVDTTAHTVTAAIPHLTDLALGGQASTGTATVTSTQTATATGTPTQTGTPEHGGSVYLPLVVDSANLSGW
jgi:hypothetical protein